MPPLCELAEARGSKVRCTQGGNVAKCPFLISDSTTDGGARLSAHARNANIKLGAAARVANGDPCDRPEGWFASLVIRRAASRDTQASTSHGSNMKAQLPMLTQMYVARALELFEGVH